MSVTTLKAEMLANEQKTCKKVLDALGRWVGTDGGMIGNAAKELEVSRRTLQRIIAESKVLTAFVKKHDVRPQWQPGKRGKRS